MTENDVEGVDNSQGSGWGEYPLDSVFVRKEERTVGEVLKRIKAGRYQLDPEFQRTFVWSIEQQSKLIESCLMRIPLPVFYVAEAKDGTVIVVDGVQRLTTLQRYVDGAFALKGLAANDTAASHQLEHQKYATLPIKLRERIEDTQLIFYILDAKAPERARLDIFDRVNSGVPLSRQQMRNSLYSGVSTKWLKRAASSREFLDATGGSLDSKSMRDREAVNRFCAFKLLGERNYRAADMDTYLGRTLEHMNTLSAIELEDLATSFQRSMLLNRDLFGRHAFRKSIRDEDREARRSVINIAFFDVCSVIFSDIYQGLTKTNKRHLRSAVINLINDSEFNIAITYSTNSTNQVATRFEMARDALGRFVN